MATTMIQELPLAPEGLDLESLENKVVRAIEMLNEARTAKAQLERELDKVKQQLHTRDQKMDAQEKELIALRKDREHARSRVEQMIAQIDTLIAAEAEA